MQKIRLLNKTEYRAHGVPPWSPWGAVQDAYLVEDSRVVVVSTASHGGAYVREGADRDRITAIIGPKFVPWAHRGGDPLGCGRTWWEEDADIWIPLLILCPYEDEVVWGAKLARRTAEGFRDPDHVYLKALQNAIDYAERRSGSGDPAVRAEMRRLRERDAAVMPIVR